jgi:phosphohistidine phosphatase SixA
VRAVETARLVVEECGRVDPDRVEITEALLNETSQAGFDRLARGMAHGHHVLLVGHAPTLAERVERLLHLPPAGGFKLGKGAMICMDWEPGRAAGALKFFVTPKLLGVKGD